MERTEIRHHKLTNIATEILEELKAKNQTYGDSWASRGGVGAFFVAVRKFDRVENLAKKNGYDIFESMSKNDGDIVDDIRDIVGYMLLWLGENEVRKGSEPRARPDSGMEHPFGYDESRDA